VKYGPNSSYAHYALAKALGRVAQTKGTMDKIKYGTAVHDEAHAALRLDSLNAGALHVLGEWNAEVMRLNGFARFTARKLLGGAVMGEASWDNAQRYLERAVALEPNRITHRLDLAAVYADRGETAKARDEYATILRLPDMDYNDRFFKTIAQQRLAALK
jgi:tetratricopeptide (TPR) repeat protein